MYIEFDLLTADQDFDIIQQHIFQWAQDYNVPYTTKVAKGLKLRLGLNHPEHFTLFFLTWNHCDYRIKNPNQT